MWCGYVRVSHVGSRGGESFRSPDDQRAAIEGWAKSRGVEVEVLDPELDESGGRADRPILMQAVAAIEAGQYEGLVVAYLSRAGRSVSHLLALWERIENAGGQVVSVAENIDTSTPAGRLTRTMIAAIAEHDLDLYRERFDSLRASATERGIWQRRQTPIGYDRDPDTRRLVANRDAPRVRRAFASRLSGASIGDIAVDLELTPGGARAVLRNRVYLGELRVGEYVNPSAHDPIVGIETFEGVQTLRAVRPSPAKRPGLLAGLIRCQGCGHIMQFRSSGPGGGVYSCGRHHSAGPCPAPTAISAGRVFALIEQIAREQLATLTARAERRTDRSDRLRDDLAKAQIELVAYLEAVSAKDVGAVPFNKGARSRRIEVERAKAELAKLSVVSLPALGAGHEVWETLDVHEKNIVLRGLLDAVVVRRCGKGRFLPLEDRIRVFAHGTLEIPRADQNHIVPVASLPFPDLDDNRVLWVASGENPL